MAKIYAPNKSYHGNSAGVTFVNGMAETDDPYLVEWFRQHGYIVEEASHEKIPGQEMSKKAGRAKKEQT